MAKIKGVFRFEGTLGGFTVDKNGVVKEATGPREVTAERTKENNQEFAEAAKAGKVLRQALAALDTGDQYLSARVTQLMRSLIPFDTTSERGKRVINMAVGGVAAAIQGLELNANAPYSSVTGSLITDSTVVVNGTNYDCTVSVKDTVGNDAKASDFYLPEGATHIEAVACLGILRFGGENQLLVPTFVASSGKKALNEVVTIAPFSAPFPSPSKFYVLGLSLNFYQQVNGQYYRLNNGAYDAAKVLKAGYTAGF
jgi:hypothetical protein